MTHAIIGAIYVVAIAGAWTLVWIEVKRIRAENCKRHHIHVAGKLRDGSCWHCKNEGYCEANCWDCD